jgi:hypothetical protein
MVMASPGVAAITGGDLAPSKRRSQAEHWIWLTIYERLGTSWPAFHSNESQTRVREPQLGSLKRVATFDFDQSQTPVAREAIEASLVKTGARLWIQPDFVGNASLRKAPEYYE